MAPERPRRLLPLAEVMSRVGLRKTAVYDRVARGDFPAPVSLGTTSRWVESEVEAWIEDRIAERDSGDAVGAHMGAPGAALESRDATIQSLRR